MIQTEIQKGQWREGVKSMGKGNAELEQISDLCSNVLCHLAKAVTICLPVFEAGGLGASPQMAV